jgi:hypothetical protein
MAHEMAVLERLKRQPSPVERIRLRRRQSDFAVSRAGHNGRRFLGVAVETAAAAGKVR